MSMLLSELWREVVAYLPERAAASFACVSKLTNHIEQKENGPRIEMQIESEEALTSFIIINRSVCFKFGTFYIRENEKLFYKLTAFLCQKPPFKRLTLDYGGLLDNPVHSLKHLPEIKTQHLQLLFNAPANECSRHLLAIHNTLVAYTGNKEAAQLLARIQARTFHLSLHMIDICEEDIYELLTLPGKAVTLDLYDISEETKERMRTVKPSWTIR